MGGKSNPDPAGVRVKIDRRQISLHLPWGLVVSIITTLLLGWYCYGSTVADRWLSGASGPGLACGVASGLIIAFEMLLWPRKYFRRLRLIPARHWMAAHLWLGLASLPLAIFHSGFHLGGWLPSLLLCLLVLAFMSGIYGLLLQNIIPGIALKLLPSETIYSQIDHVAEQNVQDIRQAIVGNCGARVWESELKAGEYVEVEAAMPSKTAVVIGAVRDIGLSSGRTIRTQIVSTDKRDSKVLWEAFDAIESYLRLGKRADRHFSKQADAGKWFAELRKACSQNSQVVIDAMEQAYDQRRQFDLQRTLHHWLHVWIPVHIGLSVGVTVLLFVHVVSALKYR